MVNPSRIRNGEIRSRITDGRISHQQGRRQHQNKQYCEEPLTHVILLRGTVSRLIPLALIITYLYKKRVKLSPVTKPYVSPLTLTPQRMPLIKRWPRKYYNNKKHYLIRSKPRRLPAGMQVSKPRHQRFLVWG